MNKFNVSKSAIIFIKGYFWKKKISIQLQMYILKNKFTQFYNDVLLIWNLTISHTSQNDDKLQQLLFTLLVGERFVTYSIGLRRGVGSSITHIDDLFLMFFTVLLP